MTAVLPPATPRTAGPPIRRRSSLCNSEAFGDSPTDRRIGAEPEHVGGIAKAAELHRDEVKPIDEGNLGMVYVPAMLAKDVSLAWPIRRRAARSPARADDAHTSSVSLSAWR